MKGRVCGLLLLVTAPAAAQLGSFITPLEEEPLRYYAGELRDPVARLQKEIDSGAVRLDFTKRRGYLEAVLQHLRVPVSSQSLVFSKTSFQLTKISPATPRAIYFNDDLYLGYVQNGDVLEISAVDPEKGAIFYSLNQREVPRPQFIRRTTECLQCHASPNTLGVPGHMVRSVYPDRDGQPLLQAGSFLTDHRSPLRERWGGWYVTGMHGKQRHMGNVVAKNARQPDQLDIAAGANVTDLKGWFNPAPYLAPHSDIVALLVLEHQTYLHNLITRVGYETRLALHSKRVMDEALGRAPGEGSDTMRRRIARTVEVLLRYLVFAEEEPLSGPVRGTSTFQADFEALGPQDRQGRSLRRMDLERRLFRYPLSYLIYSEAFDGLPPEAKEPLYRRLWEVLSGQDQSREFARLPVEDRRAALEILLETKPGLPEYFSSPSLTVR
jgi:hypothetical protein